MARTNESELTEIEDLDSVPSFGSEQEEAEYWGAHSLGDRLLSQMGPIPDDVLPPARPRTRPIAVRFDDDVIRRIKALAARKRKGYQTLLKEFVVERLYEEEKREGLIG
jgi:hypothetical protein